MQVAQQQLPMYLRQQPLLPKQLYLEQLLQLSLLLLHRSMYFIPFFSTLFLNIDFIFVPPPCILVFINYMIFTNKYLDIVFYVKFLIHSIFATIKIIIYHVLFIIIVIVLDKFFLFFISPLLFIF